MSKADLFSVERIDPTGRSNRKGEILLSIDSIGVIQDINRTGVEKLGLIQKEIMITALRGEDPEEKASAQAYIDEISESIRGRMLSEFIDLELIEGIEEEQSCGGQLEKWGPVTREGTDEPLYVQPDITPIEDENGVLVGRCVGLSDVTTLQNMAIESSHAMAGEKEAKQALEKQMWEAPNAQMDMDGLTITRWNQELENLAGYKMEEIKTRCFLKMPFVTSSAREELERLSRIRLERGEKQKSECELLFQHKDGREVWVSAEFTREFPEKGKIQTNVSFHDCTKRKKESMRDPLLKNLLNRAAFLEQARQKFNEARRYQKNFSVLLCDIDWFKKINDIHGHDGGDTCLHAFSRVLKETVRDADIVARYGGEEFVILLPETDKESATSVAEKIRSITEELIVDLGEEKDSAKMTTSIGVASFIKTDERIEDVITRADVALYSAKDSGRNAVCQAADVSEETSEVTPNAPAVPKDREDQAAE